MDRKEISYSKFLWLFLITINLSSCNNDPPPLIDFIELNVQECLSETSSGNLEILTWNMEKFPLRGDNTITEFAEVILSLDADIIALQEIGSRASFEELLAVLPGWNGQINISGNLNLAFLYKQSEVEVQGSIVTIYENDLSAFPRPPVVLQIKYNQTSLTLINIHLKCCGGEENLNRRIAASELLKEYIDNNLSQEPVIVLGDYNDIIRTGEEVGSPFMNFIADSLNYRFTDMVIANDIVSQWSYPSWPSHIDHILITNELFDYVQVTQTLSMDLCDRNYSTILSDHRPVLIRFTGL